MLLGGARAIGAWNLRGISLHQWYMHAFPASCNIPGLLHTVAHVRPSTQYIRGLIHVRITQCWH